MSQQNQSLDQYENLVHGAGDEYRMMINRLINTYKQTIQKKDARIKELEDILKEPQLPKEKKKEG